LFTYYSGTHIGNVLSVKIKLTETISKYQFGGLLESGHWAQTNDASQLHERDQWAFSILEDKQFFNVNLQKWGNPNLTRYSSHG